MPDFEIKVRPKWLDHIFDHFLWGRCAQRVLVVTDGLNFDPADGFGLTVFLNELAKAYPKPTITTMVHGTFDASVSRANYDQIWLFGSSGPSLDATEIGLLTTFMDDGGGVFATGDHAALGLALCGSIPRVRGMREWSAIPMVNERIDTLTNPGDDAVVTFNDQSDTHPQRIYPVFHGSGSSWAPHGLLQAAETIDVLPDHPHESVCYGGTATTDQADFPVVGPSRLLPEIVAYSVSAGRFVTDTGKPPTTPTLFGAISAYDGYPANQGRIVCDATWHHFVNVNLDGTDSGGRLGLQSSPGTFTPDFHQIARYYRNVLDWLTPADRRWCFRWIWFVIERYRYPLFEEFVPLPHPCPWDPRVDLGRIVESAFRTRHGHGSTWELVTDALVDADLPQLVELVRPRSADAQRDRGGRDRERTLVNVDELRQGILGSIADALLRDLPQNPLELSGRATDHDDKAIQATVVKAVREAVDVAAEHFGAAAKRTLDLF